MPEPNALVLVKIFSVSATALSFPAVLRLLDVCPMIVKLFVGVVAHAVCTVAKVPAAQNPPNSNEFATEGVAPPVVNVEPLDVLALQISAIKLVPEYSATLQHTPWLMHQSWQQ